MSSTEEEGKETNSQAKAEAFLIQAASPRCRLLVFVFTVSCPLKAGLAQEWRPIVHILGRVVDTIYLGPAPPPRLRPLRRGGRRGPPRRRLVRRRDAAGGALERAR